MTTLVETLSSSSKALYSTSKTLTSNTSSTTGLTYVSWKAIDPSGSCPREG